MVQAQSPAYGPAEHGVSRYLDRELSWLAFNERVLELAEDADVPLLERARFLAIFARNLDEFFMVRVAGLRRRLSTGVAVPAAGGMQPRQALDEIAGRSGALVVRHAACFQDQVRPALAKEGIELLRWAELDDAEREALHSLFQQQVAPVLTPLAVDPAHPFPYISGLSLNLAVVVRNPATGAEHFARVKVPPLLPRFVPAGEARFVPLEDVIAAHLPELFPGLDVVAHHTFRVTRNEDLEVDEEETESLLDALERELTRRRFGAPVRLEVEADIDAHVLDLLERELGIGEGEIFRTAGPLDLAGLFAVTDLDRPELKYRTHVPITPPELVPAEASMPADVFAALRQGDVLLHHPYHSFATSVQAFLEQAAADPDVLAIKQTLYRTSGDSPIVDALVDAAEAGKQVLVVVELKARFDERANISWARTLEQAGCHVIYGQVGLKTHAKMALVVRAENGGLRRYCHLGTGNYNPSTARQYEDLGLLTADETVGADLARLFNALSGYALTLRFDRLLVAPHELRYALLDAIEGEIAAAEHGEPAWIRVKANSVVDEELIEALYRASSAGVDVDLWVRGICALRPGVPGLSERVRVRSILGRFLEHSRVYAFANGGAPSVYLGSADLMHRNLDRRVETLVDVRAPHHVEELLRLFALAFDDDTAAWSLGADGRWTPSRMAQDGAVPLALQERLIALTMAPHDRLHPRAR